MGGKTILLDMSGLTQRKVMVTGATGFIGSHLCVRLVTAGAEVHAVCRPNSHISKSDIRAWPAQLEDLSQVRRLMRTLEPDYVFHLAGATSGARELALALPTLQANVVTTVNVLTAVAEVGCTRMVIAGSLEESETMDSVPSSPYAASKSAAAAYSRMFWRLFRTPVTIARMFMVYGPGQRDVRKLIPYTTLSLLLGRQPRLTSGRRLVDWIFVDDVISGLIALCQAKRVDGKFVDLGTGILTSVREVVERLVEIINPNIDPRFGILPDREDEIVRYAQSDQAEALLGWRPAVDLQIGLSQTVEYYRQRLEQYATKLQP